MVSGHTGNVVPGNRLRVRISCPPLRKLSIPPAQTPSLLHMRILGYCLMPNHFHLLLRPHDDGDLGRWMQSLEGIADKLGVVLRTVEPKLRTIRELWTEGKNSSG